MSTLSRRSFLKAAATSVAGLAMAACGAIPTSMPTPRPVPAAKEPVKLTYWGHAFEGRVKVLDAIIADWLKENPGAEVDHQTIANLTDKLAIAFAADTQPDMFNVTNLAVFQYAEQEVIIPIDPTAWGQQTETDIVDLYEPGTLEYNTYKGHLYGPPMEVSVFCPVFRVDHFKEYGLDPDTPPDTYQDWVAVGKAGVKRDAQGKLVRQWFEWPQGPGYAPVMFGPILLSMGSDWLNTEGTQARLNTPEGIEMLQFVHDVVHTWRLFDPAWTSPDPQGHFVQGRETYGWQNLPGARFMENNYPEMKYGDVWRPQPIFKWASGQRKNVGYTHCFCVTKGSKFPKESWQFIEYATRFPQRTEQWMDVAGLAQTRKGWNTLPKIREIPFVDTYFKEFEWSVPLPRHPKFLEIRTEIQRAIERIYATPPDSPKVVAAEFDKKVNEILARP